MYIMIYYKLQYNVLHTFNLIDRVYIYIYIGLSSIKELPNSRELSTGLVNDENSPDSVKTIAMAYWTIFIGHDLSHTAVSSMRRI